MAPGEGQGSVQASQVLPHQTRSSSSLWTFLCALDSLIWHWCLLMAGRVDECRHSGSNRCTESVFHSASYIPELFLYRNWVRDHTCFQKLLNQVGWFNYNKTGGNYVHSNLLLIRTCSSRQIGAEAAEKVQSDFHVSLILGMRHWEILNVKHFYI